MTIEWSTQQRKLSELIPWDRNPRQIRDANAKRLSDSVDRFGQVETLAIGPNNELYNGHQRLHVLAAEYGPNHVVDVRVASRALDEHERQRLVVYLHKGATGEFDFDILANEFEPADLVDWGFEPAELGFGPDDQAWANTFGELPDDRAPFRTMTFTVHDEQHETITRALAEVHKMFGDDYDTDNENRNGNALAALCGLFLEDHGLG